MDARTNEIAHVRVKDESEGCGAQNTIVSSPVPPVTKFGGLARIWHCVLKRILMMYKVKTFYAFFKRQTR